MKKIILAFTAIATLAVPAVSMASVSVTNGTGFVGKGDVQTALGYANNNAFTDADARSATFTVSTAYSVTMNGAKCGVYGSDNTVIPESVHVLAPVNLGHYAGTVNTVTSSPKISGGKVTGYNLTGVGDPTGETTPSTVDMSLWSKSCPPGEVWVGWDDARNAYTYNLVTSDLKVTIGNNSAPLPNTPVL